MRESTRSAGDRVILATSMRGCGVEQSTAFVEGDSSVSESTLGRKHESWEPTGVSREKTTLQEGCSAAALASPNSPMVSAAVGSGETIAEQSEVQDSAWQNREKDHSSTNHSSPSLVGSVLEHPENSGAVADAWSLVPPLEQTVVVDMSDDDSDFGPEIELNNAIARFPRFTIHHRSIIEGDNEWIPGERFYDIVSEFHHLLGPRFPGTVEQAFRTILTKLQQTRRSHNRRMHATHGNTPGLANEDVQRLLDGTTLDSAMYQSWKKGGFQLKFILDHVIPSKMKHGKKFSTNFAAFASDYQDVEITFDGEHFVVQGIKVSRFDEPFCLDIAYTAAVTATLSRPEEKRPKKADRIKDQPRAQHNPFHYVEPSRPSSPTSSESSNGSRRSSKVNVASNGSAASSSAASPEPSKSKAKPEPDPAPERKKPLPKYYRPVVHDRPNQPIAPARPTGNEYVTTAVGAHGYMERSDTFRYRGQDYTDPFKWWRLGVSAIVGLFNALLDLIRDTKRVYDNRGFFAAIRHFFVELDAQSNLGIFAPIVATATRGLILGTIHAIFTGVEPFVDRNQDFFGQHLVSTPETGAYFKFAVLIAYGLPNPAAGYFSGFINVRAGLRDQYYDPEILHLVNEARRLTSSDRPEDHEQIFNRVLEQHRAKMSLAETSRELATTISGAPSMYINGGIVPADHDRPTKEEIEEQNKDLQYQGTAMTPHHRVAMKHRLAIAYYHSLSSHPIPVTGPRLLNSQPPTLFVQGTSHSSQLLEAVLR